MSKASLNHEKEKTHETFLRRECYYGSYERSFYLGTDIASDALKASYKRGVLKIRIPKAGLEPKPETLAIEG